MVEENSENSVSRETSESTEGIIEETHPKELSIVDFSEFLRRTETWFKVLSGELALTEALETLTPIRRSRVVRKTSERKEKKKKKKEKKKTSKKKKKTKKEAKKGAKKTKKETKKKKTSRKSTKKSKSKSK